METPAPAATATPTGTAPTTRQRRWPLFTLGVVLFVLGPFGYFLMLKTKHLDTPWHAPALATIGLVLMLLSLRNRPKLWRSLGIVPFVAICALEWMLVIVFFRTPPYAGPARPDEKLPLFQTTLADGKPFSDGDLAVGTPTALVFFRGRW